jgi:hypothetical protein
MSCKPCEEARKALKTANNIVQGYSNLIVKDPIIEALANDRMKICMSCENRKDLVTINSVQHYYCAKCNCPLDAKVRAQNEVCPIGKW